MARLEIECHKSKKKLVPNRAVRDAKIRVRKTQRGVISRTTHTQEQLSCLPRRFSSQLAITNILTLRKLIFFQSPTGEMRERPQCVYRTMTLSVLDASMTKKASQSNGFDESIHQSPQQTPTNLNPFSNQQREGRQVHSEQNPNDPSVQMRRRRETLQVSSTWHLSTRKEPARYTLATHKK